MQPYFTKGANETIYNDCMTYANIINRGSSSICSQQYTAKHLIFIVCKIVDKFGLKYLMHITYSKGCHGRFLRSFFHPSIRLAIHPWMASYREENPGRNK
jgi:hypothetical protein